MGALLSMGKHCLHITGIPLSILWGRYWCIFGEHYIHILTHYLRLFVVN